MVGRQLTGIRVTFVHCRPTLAQVDDPERHGDLRRRRERDKDAVKVEPASPGDPPPIPLGERPTGSGGSVGVGPSASLGSGSAVGSDAFATTSFDSSGAACVSLVRRWNGRQPRHGVSADEQRTTTRTLTARQRFGKGTLDRHDHRWRRDQRNRVHGLHRNPGASFSPRTRLVSRPDPCALSWRSPCPSTARDDGCRLRSDRRRRAQMRDRCRRSHRVHGQRVVNGHRQAAVGSHSERAGRKFLRRSAASFGYPPICNRRGGECAASPAASPHRTRPSHQQDDRSVGMRWTSRGP